MAHGGKEEEIWIIDQGPKREIVENKGQPELGS
jgi:hypothetical protein